MKQVKCVKCYQPPNKRAKIGVSFKFPKLFMKVHCPISSKIVTKCPFEEN